eukprot:16055737-Heterocapsa_arctica.AAC.1
MLFEPDKPVFLACTTAACDQAKSEFPTLNFRFKQILYKYRGEDGKVPNRAGLELTGRWTRFQMEK